MSESVWTPGGAAGASVFRPSSLPDYSDLVIGTLTDLRNYTGTSILLYVQGDTAAGDGYAGWFYKVTGAAAATYEEDEHNTILPTGGDGSQAWIRMEEAIQNLRVINKTAGTLSAGAAVYISGADATTNLPTVAIADNTAKATAGVVGILTQDLIVDEVGYVSKGSLKDQVTNAFLIGDTLYLGAAGALTSTKPTGANFPVVVGTVLKVHATDGIIHVAPSQAIDVSDIPDVYSISQTYSKSEVDTLINGLAWKDVSFKTNADSPITVVQADDGVMFVVDTSAGAVTVNLPQISALSLPFTIGVKKTTDDNNLVTINRGGPSDLIDGATSVTIGVKDSGYVFIPDIDPAPDAWTTVAIGSTARSQQDTYAQGVTAITPPNWARDVFVELWGAGGAGGSDDDNSQNPSAGRGGNYLSFRCPVGWLSVGGADIVCSIGAGGLNTGVGIHQPGGNGGDTSVTAQNWLGAGGTDQAIARGGQGGEASWTVPSANDANQLVGITPVYEELPPWVAGNNGATSHNTIMAGATGGNADENALYWDAGTSQYGGNGGRGYGENTPLGITGENGVVPGGGGGAGHDNAAGDGADGQIRITWSN